eukprot:COSAG03_NODE_24869_length_269_cov_0.882353_1_plen_49_part_01
MTPRKCEGVGIVERRLNIAGVICQVSADRDIDAGAGAVAAAGAATGSCW